MKRVFSLILALVLALALTACDRGMIRDTKEAVESMLPTARPVESMEPVESIEPVETPPIDTDLPAETGN